MLERLKKKAERLVKWIKFLASLEKKQQLTVKFCEKVAENAKIKTARAQGDLFNAARREVNSLKRRTDANIALAEKLAEKNTEYADARNKAIDIAHNAFN